MLLFYPLILLVLELAELELYNAFSVFYSKYNNILDIKAFADLANEVKDVNGKSAFIMFRSEDIFNMIADPYRDPQTTQHLLNTCLIQGKIHNPQYTMDDAKAYLEKIFDDMKSRRDYFCFKDNKE